jgi:hypothetical protein
MPSYIDDAAKAADDLIRRLGGEKPIRAYHGSPHDFRKFDFANIGRGAGNQSYGHGLYFAENERIAKRYKVPPGKLYKVDIAQPENAFVDFELPLSAQPRIAQAFDAANGLLPRRDAKLFSRFLTEDPDGEKAYMLLDHLLGSERTATAMFDAGVPGTRFLDVTGEGTRNYVMFPGTEDSIHILRKYGMLAPIPAAAALQDGDTP